MSSLTPLTFPEILGRFVLAAGLLVPLNLVLAFVFSRLTNVPPGFAPFTSAPIIAGSVAGPLISTVGYLLLWTFIRDQRVLHLVFIAGGIALLVASYNLPWHLTYSASPRFTGVTIAAQFALGLLHTIVVGVSVISLLRRQRPS